MRICNIEHTFAEIPLSFGGTVKQTRTCLERLEHKVIVALLHHLLAARILSGDEIVIHFSSGLIPTGKRSSVCGQCEERNLSRRQIGLYKKLQGKMILQ